eukprot:ANDGO_03768.mRNA.1 Tyrosyl-DNA phosphodiesterase 1
MLFAVNQILSFASNSPANSSKSVGTLRLRDQVTKDAQFIVATSYNFSLDWLLDVVPMVNLIPIWFCHGSVSKTLSTMTLDEFDKYWSHYPMFRPHFPKLPSFGTNHGKLFIVFYPTYMRLVILTANLTELDHSGKFQLAWSRDFPIRETQPGVSQRNPFDLDSFGFLLWDYLDRLWDSGKSFRTHVLSRLSQADFSNTGDVKLVTSVPGAHTGSALYRYGHMRVRKLLGAVRSSPFTKPTASSSRKLWCTCSSIGALSDSFLTDQLARSFGCKDVQLSWHSVFDVENSFFATEMADHLWLESKQCTPHLRERMTNLRFRHESGILSHAKFYCNSVKSSSQSVDFVLVTSANLSKAAWGSLSSDDDSLRILSFEIGVLFQPIDMSADELPFLLPSPTYAEGDGPFTRSGRTS